VAPASSESGAADSSANANHAHDATIREQARQVEEYLSRIAELEAQVAQLEAQLHEQQQHANGGTTTTTRAATGNGDDSARVAALEAQLAEITAKDAAKAREISTLSRRLADTDKQLDEVFDRCELLSNRANEAEVCEQRHSPSLDHSIA